MDTVAFVKKFPIKSFEKDEALLEQGDVSDTLLAIRTGFVKVTTLDTQGIERMLWIAGRYDIIPTEQLFSLNRPLQFFYTALSKGDAYRINKAELLSTARTDPRLMGEIAQTMSNHYDDLLERINSTEQSTVRQKLIANLRYLAERFSADRQVDLRALGLHLTHEDIAMLTGSTRETISLELQKLRTAGMISYDRKHFIVDLDTCMA